jgi:uncharacterized protein YdiU (UPF0061 family)
LQIEQLSYGDAFVRTLPGDARTDNRTREVLGACYSRVQPTAVPKPELLVLVPEVAQLIGLEPSPDLAEVLAGNRIVPGMAPYAACYGGHQFGTWAGQLGDGRAITLGEVTHNGETWELQLKGAGPTPYSRRADGRAVLRSSLRELVCSEAMFHLGVPTTRALSLVLTGEPVMRDLLYDGHPEYEPGAVVCRVAPTFLRFGSYEIHSSRDDHATLKKLVDFTLEHHFAGMSVAEMFDEVMRRTAWLLAEWMRVGFVHGVMNTDNMSILGLTIDYGPYGWLEPFDPDWTPNITDASGRRYRFGNQPAVAHWNLAQLARALAPVSDLDALRRSLDAFPVEFSTHYRATMLRKLGLSGGHGGDDALLAELADLMTHVETDYTLLFRRLAEPTFESVRDAFYAEPDRARVTEWLAKYVARDRDVAGMQSINPLYVPRNYLVQQVIEATAQGDRSALPELIDVLRQPYTEQAGRQRFAAKRPEWARVKPGCSMLSCSS